MFTSFAAECRLKLAESLAETVLVCSDKFVTLLAIQDEIELGNRLDLESRGSLAIRTTLDSAEDDMLDAISTSLSLKNGLESHARRASRRPEVNDNATIVPNDSLQLD